MKNFRMIIAIVFVCAFMFGVTRAKAQTAPETVSTDPLPTISKSDVELRARFPRPFGPHLGYLAHKLGVSNYSTDQDRRRISGILIPRLYLSNESVFSMFEILVMRNAILNVWLNECKRPNEKDRLHVGNVPQIPFINYMQRTKEFAIDTWREEERSLSMRRYPMDNFVLPKQQPGPRASNGYLESGVSNEGVGSFPWIELASDIFVGLGDPIHDPVKDRYTMAPSIIIVF
jgi:hypothetical protein